MPISHHHVDLPLSTNLHPQKTNADSLFLVVSDINKATLLPPNRSTKIVVVKSIKYHRLLSVTIVGKVGNTLLACHTGILILMVFVGAVLTGTEKLAYSSGVLLVGHALVGQASRRAREKKRALLGACPSRRVPSSAHPLLARQVFQYL
jgi:hypothetical protein